MTDLVTRLRNWQVVYREEENDPPDENTLCIKAADEIERLRDENKRLREALEAVAAEAYVSADNWPIGWRDVATCRIDIARAALKEEEEFSFD